MERRTTARNKRARKRSISTPEPIGRHAGEEDIGKPCSEVVDCSYEALLGGAGVGEGLDEAGIDVDGCYDADIVTVGEGGLVLVWGLEKVNLEERRGKRTPRGRIPMRRIYTGLPALWFRYSGGQRASLALSLSPLRGLR